MQSQKQVASDKQKDVGSLQHPAAIPGRGAAGSGGGEMGFVEEDEESPEDQSESEDSEEGEDGPHVPLSG